jgi:phosphoesterase RecJ-like protein
VATKSNDPLSQKIHQSEYPLVVSHERPDGDAIGSTIAMGLALHKIGSKPQLVIADGVPSRFHFLAGAGEIKAQLTDEFDLIIVLDCSDTQRIGLSLPRQPDINIDHHPTNNHFAVHNLVRPQAAATTEILFELLPQLNVDIDEEIASALLLGLITDTIGFRTPSVHPGVFHMAAQLLEHGADINTIYNRALNQRSYVGARYWGQGLQKLNKDGELLWAELSLADRKAVAYPGNDDADLINFLTTIESPTVTLIFVEQAEGKVKVSWRSRPGVNVAQIASSFGGGGHEQAAGAMIAGTLEEVKSNVLRATKPLVSPSKEDS